MKIILLSAVFLAFILMAEFFVGSLAGCTPISAPAKAVIQSGHDQAKIDAAKQKDEATTRAAEINAKGKVNEANAKNSPTAHPFAATNSRVKTACKILGVLSFFGFIVWIVSLGLRSTALSALASITVPVGRSLCVCSFAFAIALPFIFNPIVAGIVIAGVTTWLIVEVVKHESIPAGFAAFEAEIKQLTCGADVGKEPAVSSPASSPIVAVAAAVAKL